MYIFSQTGGRGGACGSTMEKEILGVSSFSADGFSTSVWNSDGDYLYLSFVNNTRKVLSIIHPSPKTSPLLLWLLYQISKQASSKHLYKEERKEGRQGGKLTSNNMVWVG